MSVQTTIQLERDHARQLARWQELQADPELAKLPYGIETDRLGRIIMSPPPLFDHARYVARIIELLHRLLKSGQAFGETPIVTLDGVKVTDAAWISADYAGELKDRHPVALERAPEICIEVLSPSNTAEEMAEKRALYFEAGALEVWLCDLKGQLSFYAPSKCSVSALCPSFPSQIEGFGRGTQ